MIQSNNPALRAFEQPARWSDLEAPVTQKSSVMTLQGTINATGVLLGLCAASAFAAVTWAGQYLSLVTFAGFASAFVLAFVIIFKPRTAQFLASVYAILMGAALGGISMMYQSWVSAQSGSTSTVVQIGDSIVFQAILLTFGIAGAMLLAYSLRIIRATPMFIRVMMILIIGYLLTALGTMLLRAFGAGIPYLHNMGPLGIAIAAGVVVLAALTLIIDFKIIEDGINMRAPKWMEWYGAFGLMVTLVWLYLRVLHLLALLRKNN